MRTLLAMTAISMLLGLGACTALEKGAAQDPAKCERDPKCATKSRTPDCDEQCAYSPTCTDRCREINASSGQTEPR